MLRISIVVVAALAACSSKAPPVAHAPVVVAIDAAPVPVPVAAAAPGARGDACAPTESPAGSCGDGLLCMPVPGGYCTSFCGATGTACDDGTCVETGRGGALCARSCTADADCRTGEGYVCDPVWRACVLPGLAAPKAPVCPTPAQALAKRAFGPAAQLTGEKSPGLYQFEPATALAGDGTVVAVYIGRGRMMDTNRLGVARVPRAGAASDALAPSDRDSAFDPWIARDASGRLHAVWLAFDGVRAPEKRMEIAYATSTDGGVTWSAPRAVHDAADCPDEQPGCMDKPMVAIGPDAGGKGEVVYVAYASEADGREGLRVIASRDGGKTFAPSVLAMSATYGDLAIAADGAVHVVGVDGSPQGGAFGKVGQAIVHAVSTDGGATFTATAHASGDGEAIPFFFVNPGVEVDAKRKTIYVTYARGGADAAWDIVLAASKDGGATWTRTIVNDDGHCAAHAVPMAALDGKTGRVHVTWADDRDGHGALAYAVCEPGGARCGANQRVSDAPWAAFSFVRHAGPWMGEYSGLVIDERRRVLHAVWTQPVATPAGPVSRIFHAQAKL